MADSQLECMEDGRIGAGVPETKPEFYYSEQQRVAVEELLREGDGAFKTLLKKDEAKDFLSAREIKLLTNTFKHYADHDPEGSSKKTAPTGAEGDPAGQDGDSGVHSTYWPQMSDTEVPPLDIGWPSGGLFKGVTRVSVHTHPPKDNGPHIKEVVRRLIQEANKVIAIVMDLLTDLHVLQDLMDAAWRRSVAVYILLDEQGVPHFLDMCQRLQIGSQHLRNIRTRTLQGVGLSLSSGRLPGALCAKYMLVDGDKVMFGSYSFSWSTSRMDRNMITVMTGQVVDFFDRDFRELYAVSEKLNLYKEFHVSPSADKAPGITRARAESKRPALPATTSRFQVSLGDAQNTNIQVPAHKYYNPKYLLALGEVPRPTGSLQEPGPRRALAAVVEDMDAIGPQLTSSEKMGQVNAVPSEAPSEPLQGPNRAVRSKKSSKWKLRLFRGKTVRKLSANSLVNSAPPSPVETSQADDDDPEVMVRSPSKTATKPPKLGRRTESEQTVNAAHDGDGLQGQRQNKQTCKMS